MVVQRSKSFMAAGRSLRRADTGGRLCETGESLSKRAVGPNTGRAFSNRLSIWCGKPCTHVCRPPRLDVDDGPAAEPSTSRENVIAVLATLDVYKIGIARELRQMSPSCVWWIPRPPSGGTDAQSPVTRPYVIKLKLYPISEHWLHFYSRIPKSIPEELDGKSQFLTKNMSLGVLSWGTVRGPGIRNNRSTEFKKQKWWNYIIKITIISMIFLLYVTTTTLQYMFGLPLV